jgi:DinB superfamily
MSDTTGDPRDAYALARAVLEASSDTLQSLLRAMPAESAGERPVEDEWSGLEVMGHLLTVEALLRHRVEAIVAGNGGPIARLDIPHQPTPPSLPVALAAWRDRRQQNLAWLAGLDLEQRRRTGVLPQLGPISADEQVCEWAYHDLEHLRQLMALLEHRLHPGMGPFRAVYRRPFETAESPKS